MPREAEPDLEKIDDILSKLTRNDQLDPSQFPPELAGFFEATSKLPAWADPAKILAGEELFRRWGMEALAALLCASLPECYTMRSEVQVLAATQRLQVHATAHPADGQRPRRHQGSARRGLGLREPAPTAGAVGKQICCLDLNACLRVREFEATVIDQG